MQAGWAASLLPTQGQLGSGMANKLIPMKFHLFCRDAFAGCLLHFCHSVTRGCTTDVAQLTSGGPGASKHIHKSQVIKNRGIRKWRTMRKIVCDVLAQEGTSSTPALAESGRWRRAEPRKDQPSRQMLTPGWSLPRQSNMRRDIMAAGSEGCLGGLVAGHTGPLVVDFILCEVASHQAYLLGQPASSYVAASQSAAGAGDLPGKH